MKRVLLLCLCLFFVVRVDAWPCWYLNGFAGWNVVENPSSFELNKEGYLFGGSIGNKFLPLLRIETEFAYRQNDYTHYIVNDTHYPVSGTHRTYSLATNVLFDIPFCIPLVSPFMGIGIGYGVEHGQVEFPDSVVSISGYDKLKYTHRDFIYQGMGGICLDLILNTDIRAAFVYLNGVDFLHNFALAVSLRHYF